jgi:hypothetical protein
MTVLQVTVILGQPENLQNTVITQAYGSPSTPGKTPFVYVDFRREIDAARCCFLVPDRFARIHNGVISHPSIWLDKQHKLLLYFNAGGSLREILLVPNKLEPATFQEWCKHQFNRFKRAVGI